MRGDSFQIVVIFHWPLFVRPFFPFLRTDGHAWCDIRRLRQFTFEVRRASTLGFNDEDARTVCWGSAETRPVLDHEATNHGKVEIQVSTRSRGYKFGEGLASMKLSDTLAARLQRHVDPPVISSARSTWQGLPDQSFMIVSPHTSNTYIHISLSSFNPTHPLSPFLHSFFLPRFFLPPSEMANTCRCNNRLYYWRKKFLRRTCCTCDASW